MLGLFKDAVAHNEAARKALQSLEKIAPPKGPLTEAQWKQLAADIAAADAAHISFASALSDTDMTVPVKIEWYGGNPGSVPLFFLLNQVTTHSTHHRGQVSQILDALKVDNNYSAFSPATLPK
jgi:uncharacterized damage-inducible protein DinB